MYNLLLLFQFITVTAENHDSPLQSYASGLLVDILEDKVKQF